MKKRGLVLKRDIALSKYCTLKIGGPARYLIVVRSVDEVKEAIQFSHLEKLPYLILGRGSNALFSDSGFSGVVIVNKIDFYSSNEELHTAGAGYNFSLLGTKTAKAGWAGLEFASGIPGSVGGAIFMNAGANGRETVDSLVEVDYLTDEGELFTFKKEKLEFSYRYSSFQKMKGAIISATFSLDSSSDARDRQKKLIHYRTNTQPYSDASAGCAFRNPKGDAAGRLIEQAGLKGLSVGGAAVSSKHGNFIINQNGATSEDVIALIELVKERVKERTGFLLEEEVRLMSKGES
jgi:UDP-N-acetylmuramate dehydrogenase